MDSENSKKNSDVSKKESDIFLKPEEDFTGIGVTKKLSRVVSIKLTNKNLLLNKEKAVIKVTGNEVRAKVNAEKNENKNNVNTFNNSINKENKSKSNSKVTAKFLFTSIQKPYQQYDSYKKKKVDINDPIFKLPLEQGWKRFVVKRSVQVNKAYDVYYFSPDNERFRSMKQIKKKLDSLNGNNSLTINNFTFQPDHIDMNYQPKQVINDALPNKSETSDTVNQQTI